VIDFHGTVTKVQQATATTGTVTVHVVGFDIPVKVTADTDIALHGDLVGLAGIKVNDFVKVEGFFAAAGITADEIQILDPARGSFRLRGQITAAATTAGGRTITVLGVQVLVDADTKIERRGPDGGFTAAQLVSGLDVDVMGILKDGVLVASRVKVGNRDDDAIRVSFEGKISAIQGTRIDVGTANGGLAIVRTNSATVVNGTLAVGKNVAVKGTLNAQLEVVADRITVEGASGQGGGDDGKDEFKKEVKLVAVAAGTTLKGEAKIELPHDGKTEQEVEVELENGVASKEYRLLVTFGAAGTVDFGAFTANSKGEAKVSYSTKPNGQDRNLTPLLPAGKTLKDVTKIQVTDANKVVILEATL
jgi:hypothetical protein